MQIAIISDTHDQIGYIDRFLFFAKENIDLIIHCGDVTTLDTLAYLSVHWEKQIHLSLGNADAFKYSRTWKNNIAPNVIVYENDGKLEVDSVKIHFNHYPDIAKRKAESEKYDFVFYGHTHKPWLERVGDTYLANPGTLSGQRSDPSFAILDTKTKYLSLKRLSDI